MTIFGMLIGEVREHFDRCHRGWRGSFDASGPDDNAMWMEFFPRGGGISLLLRVISEGDTVFASEFGVGVNMNASPNERFDLEEPGSVERLLAFLDEWVERRK